MIELDDVADMQAGRWRAKHKENAAVASRIAVRQCHIQFLNGRAHGMTPNEAVEKAVSRASYVWQFTVCGLDFKE